jgi:DNA modification methylase
MKPYFEDNDVQIYLGDCREILPQLGQVDLVLTDPPYGKQWARGVNAIGVVKDINEKLENVSWDKERPSQDCFSKCLEISKNQIIFGGNYFTDYLYPSNCWIIWDKLGDFKRGEQIPFGDVELAWTSFKRTCKKYTLRVQGFVNDSQDIRVHPTQKPTEVIQMILQDFSLPTDIILDPFMGSGTTLRASKNIGRKAIGIEIEERYCEIAVKRMAQTVMNLSV